MDDAQECLRNEILCLTSEFREGLGQFEADPAVEPVLDTLVRSGRSLRGAASRSGLQALLRYGTALDRMATVRSTLAGTDQSTARRVLAGMADAVGILEQALDACLEGMVPERLDRLYADLCETLPVPWRASIEMDDTVFERQLCEAVARADASRHEAAAAEPAADEDPDAAFHRELFEAFTTEAAERLHRCEELLLQLGRGPNDCDLVDALFREFHTLKGAAAAVDFTAAATQLHDGESLLQDIRDGAAQVDGGALVDFLFRLTDSVRGLIDAASGRPPSRAVISDVMHGIALAKAASNQTPAMPDDIAVPEALPDPCELRKTQDAEEINPQLRRFIEALDPQAGPFSQMASSLQQEVNSLRLVALDGVLRRLRRPLRDAARQEGKRVEIELLGGDVRVDHVVAERLFAPLLHLVRNAVAHGIESPTDREGCGKPRTGTVRVRAQQRATHLLITVEDDGAGLNFDAILAKATARHWIDPSHPPTRTELARVIFRPGLSTRDAANPVAGRGVGLDVVARDIEALGGRVDVESLEGRGTSIRLSIPLRPVAAVCTRVQAAASAPSEPLSNRQTPA